PAVKPCYGSGLPPLFRCADIVYSQLISTVNGYTSLSKKGLSMTMDCPRSHMAILQSKCVSFSSAVHLCPSRGWIRECSQRK
ncbi:hypothetical protein CEXT_43951, partial [Caerostris extrusa]